MRLTPKTRKIDRAKFVASWTRSPVLFDAMIEAGYQPAQARKGRAALSKPLLAIVDGTDGPEFTLEEYERLGSLVETPEQAERIIRGFLLTGLMKRNGKGTDAARLLAQLRSINLLTPDKHVGVFIIEAPTQTVLDGVFDVDEAFPGLPGG